MTYLNLAVVNSYIQSQQQRQVRSLERIIFITKLYDNRKFFITLLLTLNMSVF